MICPHCGAQISYKANFCENCGKRIGEADQAEHPEQEYQAENAEQHEKNLPTIIPVVAALAIVLVASLIAFFAVIKPRMGDNPGRSTASEQETSADSETSTETGSKTDKNANEDASDTNKTMYVSSEDGLMLREGPNTETESVYVLSYGKDIRVEKTENNWAYTTVDGISGWCSMEYLTEKKPEIKVNEATPSSEDEKSRLVEPANIAEAGYHGIVNTEEGLNMRYGPGEDYGVIEVLPNGTYVVEKGWDGEWMYVECNGKLGWVHSSYISAYVGGKEKPAIYLYPEKTTDVTVRVDLKDGRFTYTDPKGTNSGNNGKESTEWMVSADPDGTLTDKETGRTYDYLFWESNDNSEYDWSEGYVIAGCDTETFLRSTLPKIGLNEKEATEFISYWLPRMRNHKFNLITFQNECYTDSADLKVYPEPDSMLRVFMVFRELDKAISIREPRINTFERQGFTVVEWGGAEKDK